MGGILGVRILFSLHLHLRLRNRWLCLLRSALKILDTPFRALAKSDVFELYWYDMYYATFNHLSMSLLH